MKSTFHWIIVEQSNRIKRVPNIVFKLLKWFQILFRIWYLRLFYNHIPWVFLHEVDRIQVLMSIPKQNFRFRICFAHQNNKWNSVHLWFFFNDGWSIVFVPIRSYNKDTLPSITSFKSDSQKYSFLSQLKKSARSCVGQFVNDEKIYFKHVSFLDRPISDKSLPSSEQ